jgi:DUF1707 SHOCT-like domain
MTGDTGIPSHGPAAGASRAAAVARSTPDPVKRDPALLRISDQERQEFVDQLTRHCAEGRITFDELDERVAKAWQARTEADLRPLAADLPALPAAKAKAPDVKSWLADGRALLMAAPSRILVAGAAGLALIFLLLLLFAGHDYGGPPR